MATFFCPRSEASPSTSSLRSRLPPSLLGSESDGLSESSVDSIHLTIYGLWVAI